MFEHDEVEPATSPASAGGRPVFSSRFLEVDADLLYAIIRTGGKWKGNGAITIAHV